MLAAAAVLWPSRLASPLAGAPLDRPLEAVALGVGLAWRVIACPRAHPRFLRQPAARTLIVALLLGLRTGLMWTQEWGCTATDWGDDPFAGPDAKPKRYSEWGGRQKHATISRPPWPESNNLPSGIPGTLQNLGE